MVVVGDKMPSVSLAENNPDSKVDISELCAGKKVVIFGVPGAFTPGCSKTHLPGYVESAEDLKKIKGVDEIVCIAVNDPFVMEAWGKQHGAEGKVGHMPSIFSNLIVQVRMLADTSADLTKALGLELDLTPVLGSVRCKRFSMMVEDGAVTQINVEPDGTGLTCSLASSLQ